LKSEKSWRVVENEKVQKKQAILQKKQAV
jgi:hypothetical protein